MPTLRERLGAWVAFGRKATGPVEFHPASSLWFGNGLGLQPSATTLLGESMGTADVATRAIGNRLGSLNPQVKVSTRGEEGTLVDEILDDHPLKIMLDRPHPNFSRAQLFRLTGQWVVTVGAAYWLKVGNGFGVPRELHPIPPAKISPAWKDGVIARYIVDDGVGRRRTLDADTVVRIALPDPADPYSAEGYLAPLGITADSSKFAAQHLRSRYQNDATPHSVIETDEKAQKFSKPEMDTFYREWRRRYHSLDGTERGGPGILPLGYHLIQLAMQSGADVVPLLDFWERQLLRGYGVPRSVLGEVVSGDRSSAETNQYVMDLHTIMPLANLIAEALTYQLASDFDDSVFVEFEPFVSHDKQHTLLQEQSDLDRKVRSINMVRVDRGLDPAEWGEDPVAKIGEGPYDPSSGFDLPEDDASAFGDEDEEDEERTRTRALPFFTPAAEWRRQIRREKKFVPTFQRAMVGILAMQKRSVLKKLKEAMPRSRALEDELFDPAEWRKIFRIRIRPVREQVYKDAGATTLAGIGVEAGFVFGEAQQAELIRQGALLVRRVNATTGKRLKAAVSKAQAEIIAGEIKGGLEGGAGIEHIAARIRGVFSVRRSEARTIARTEVLKASQSAQLEAFEQSGVVERKQWNTSLDDAVRPDHLDTEGQIVDRDDAFTLGNGERADAPGIGEGGAQLSAGNTINCRCFVTPVVEG
jgi:SPP1 gp7 family putative phage head morphogenesis protein